VLLLVSLTVERPIYLALELDRSSEMTGVRTDEGSVNHSIALSLRGWPQFVPSGEREKEKQVRGHHQR
jgi:hypothetical protein